MFVIYRTEQYMCHMKLKKLCWYRGLKFVITELHMIWLIIEVISKYHMLWKCYESNIIVKSTQQQYFALVLKLSSCEHTETYNKFNSSYIKLSHTLYCTCGINISCYQYMWQAYENRPCEREKLLILLSFLYHNLITIYTNGTKVFCWCRI